MINAIALSIAVSIDATSSPRAVFTHPKTVSASGFFIDVSYGIKSDGSEEGFSKVTSPVTLASFNSTPSSVAFMR